MDVATLNSAPTTLLTIVIALLISCAQSVAAKPPQLRQQGTELLVSSRRIIQQDVDPQTESPQLEEQQPEDPAVTNADRDLITLRLIDEELAKVDQAELREKTKNAIVKHYLTARQYLTFAISDAAKAADFRKESLNAVDRRQELRSAIEAFDAAKETAAPMPTALTDLEQLKLTCENESEEYQRKLKAAFEEPERRRIRLLDLPALENKTQNRIAEVRVQLATEAPASDNPMMTRGRFVELRSEKQNLEQSLELFRVERDAYEATAGNLSLQKSLATKELERANAKLKLVVDELGKLREEETKLMLSDAVEEVAKYETLLRNLEILDRDKVELSKLTPLAKYNLELAEVLADETEDLQQTRERRSEGQAAVQKMGAELETMQSRVEAIGLSYEVGAMLRRDKSNLINQQTPFLTTDAGEKLQSVQLKKFRWQDERAALSDISVAVAREFEAADVTAPNAIENLTPTAEDLLKSRRKILEKLEDTEIDLLHDLLEVKSLQAQYSNKSIEYTDFLDERILWVRSEPALGIGDLDGIKHASRWFMLPEHWESIHSAISNRVQSNLPSVALAALGLLGLVLFQPRSRSELKRVGAIAAKRGCREFSPTAAGFIQTILLAFFWPAIGLALGWLITDKQQQQTFVLAIGRALTITSLVALPLEVLRCICRNQGLAKNHFSWTEGFRVAVKRYTGWFMAFALPLLFLIVAIEASNKNEFNRLGRLAMLFLLAFCIFYAYRIFTVFRPGGASWNPEANGFDSTVNRIRSLIFVAILVGLVMLFLFAAMGYYESVYKIGSSLLQSVQLLIWSVIAFGLAMRFFLVRRRNLRFEQLIQQRRAALAAAEKQAESGMAIAAEALDIDLQNESGMDITDVSRQARELTGVIFLIVIGLSLLGIWQYLLPATKILDSWKLWPVQIGDSADVGFVTARDLLMSLIAFAVTFFSVRNIPGTLELLLLQRLPLDAGARYAVASIFRYILLVVGVVIALGFLKIPWSKYSWLVAAVSVGLGFGLQEIVANFVSGLILLLERPVRVGDVVTIDGVTGIVSRIQMRATTVTNWDNQELVVPNKDLISGKLLNWTLSSVINRIALKVGVAYGTDVGKVREIVSKIVDRHPDVLKEPPAIITFEEFGPSSMNFVIRCCTTSIKRRWHLIDEINSAVNEAFEREGIEIPLPQHVVHMIDETGAEIHPDESAEDWPEQH